MFEWFEQDLSIQAFCCAARTRHRLPAVHYRTSQEGDGTVIALRATHPEKLLNTGSSAVSRPTSIATLQVKQSAADGQTEG